MIKHFCDRCKKEISRPKITKIEISTNTFDLGDEYEYELCDNCATSLKQFFDCGRPISHGELVQMQKAKEDKNED